MAIQISQNSYGVMTSPPFMPPFTLLAAPKGGYIVKGGVYDISYDSNSGIALAGTLDECLDYMRDRMIDGRKAQEPPKPCTCRG